MSKGATAGSGDMEWSGGGGAEGRDRTSPASVLRSLLPELVVDEDGIFR